VQHYINVVHIPNIHETLIKGIRFLYLLSCQLMDSKLDFCKTTLVRIQEIMFNNVVMAVQACIYTIDMATTATLLHEHTGHDF